MNRLGTFGFNIKDVQNLTKGATEAVKVGQSLACAKETEEINKLKTQRVVCCLGGLAAGAILGWTLSKRM